jgi:hypothetical protein
MSKSYITGPLTMNTNTKVIQKVSKKVIVGLKIFSLPTFPLKSPKSTPVTISVKTNYFPKTITYWLS